jgi:uncharacterized protein (TIGR03086 family)
MDMLDLFERGTHWSAGKIPGAVAKLGDSTPCDEWNVRTLLNHMIDTHHYFTGVARGESPALPASPPPDVLADDPVAHYEEARQATLKAFSEPGVVEKTGPSLGIAFVDQLVHGWDLATATGQDATIPDDLAQAAFQMIEGRMPPDRRGDAFKPEVPMPADASAQEKLLGYGGRAPH